MLEPVAAADHAAFDELVLLEGREERGPKLAGKPSGLHDRADPTPQVVERRDRVGRPALRVQIDLVEPDDATGPHEPDELGDSGRRIRLMDDDEPSDDGVEAALAGQDFERVEVALDEAHVGELLLVRARHREGESICAVIDADHPAGGPDQVGRDEQDVAGPGADVEHTHARLKPRALQEVAGGRPKERALGLQTP